APSVRDPIPRGGHEPLEWARGPEGSGRSGLGGGAMARVRRRGRGTWALIAVAAASAVAIAVAVWIVQARRAASAESMAAIRAALAAQRWPEAERKLDRHVASFPDDGEARVMLAALLTGRGRQDEARRVLLAVRESDPARSKALSLLGEIAVRGRRAAEAERALRQAADADP